MKISSAARLKKGEAKVGEKEVKTVGNNLISFDPLHSCDDWWMFRIELLTRARNPKAYNCSLELKGSREKVSDE